MSASDMNLMEMGHGPRDDHAGYTITWKNVSCDMSVGGGLFGGEKRTVHALADASGFARPGESLAIIGQSGAGKTTLVDILNQRKSYGKVTGEVLVNGKKPDQFFKKRAGVIYNDMAHIPTMTVRETLMFAAECRMPRASTHEDRVRRVDEVIDGLKLRKAEHTPVGDELIRGVSTGEKKRTEVGIEMVARPKVLFLDEPTSGLDDFGARFTMALVLDYIKSENVAVIIIIHQPAEAVYNLFDRVMIIGGGKVAYFGSNAEAPAFFKERGYPVPELQNPIEHFVDVVSLDPNAAADFYAKSDLYARNMAEIQRLEAASYDEVPHSAYLYERNIFDQWKLLSVRVLQRYARNPSTSWGRFVMFTIAAFCFGGVFFNLGNDVQGVRNRLAVASTFGFLPIFVAVAAVPQFLEDRELYIQERATAFYSTFPYWFTYLFTEGCINIVISTIQIIINFYMAGFPSSKFGSIYGILFVQIWLATVVSQAWSSWCKTLVQAYTALWAAGLIFYAFSGTQASLQTINPALRWLSDINYWRWTMQHIVFQVLYDFEIDCPPIPSSTFIGGVSSAFRPIVANGFAANGSNTAAVAPLSTALTSMNALTIAATQPGVPAGVAATLNATVGALAAQVAPISRFPSNFTNPAVYTPAMASNSFYGALGIVNGLVTDSPSVFSIQTFCPVGQGKDFIAKYRDVTPENLASTNAAYGIDIALFAFFALMTFTGLVYSRRYRRR